MPARVFCKTGELAGAEYQIPNEATIGRDSSNNIVLKLKTVSGKHARIFFDENERSYFLEDLHSRNGTKLDGMKVTEKEKLGKLHVITFARIADFIFQRMGEDELRGGIDVTTSKHKTIVDQDVVFVPPGIDRGEKGRRIDAGAKKVQKTIHEDKMFQMPALPDEKEQFHGMAARSESILLEVRTPEGKTWSLKLKDGENVVGRSADCEVCIKDPSVSRRHAMLKIESGRIRLKDLDSKNHTFVGKKKIKSEVEIQTDIEIKFGKIEAKLIFPEPRN